jgi:hypothetical protein
MRTVLIGLALALTPAGVAVAYTPSVPSAVITVQAGDAGPTLFTPDDWRPAAEAGDRYPMFAAERRRIETEVRRAMEAGPNVPVPRDLGGGPTHEQHKANYKLIAGAGALYRLTGDRAYADFARDLLLAYADLYPTLGRHPAGRSSVKGRLFWQALNDSVWLVYASQGYDAIRDSLSDADRSRIDDDVFRRMARFLVEENAEYFDRIHNHATWATAGVGMTGYVLRDDRLVEQALRGTRADGSAGFLRQIDELFSPDGYYAEGPYYQRYALAPFIIFARAIQTNEPERGIFAYRDGVLLKAVEGVIQASYDGRIIPINDSIPQKGLDTEEIVTGVAVAFAQTGDDRLLSIAEGQGRTILTPDGVAVARGVAEDRARPFDFRSMSFSDGPNGDRGALALIRSGGADGQLLVMKNTQQGQGHGHFDRLNWLFYDQGSPVVTDYGAARFLNIEAKDGGGYLDENESWAMSTIAHNTLTVDGQSQFGGNWEHAEQFAMTQEAFETSPGFQAARGRTADAYPGVEMTRTLALVEHPDLSAPLVIDVLRADGDRPRLYDLPLHFAGHIITQGFEARHAPETRPVLGDRAGYQHLWVDAQSEAGEEPRSLTWLQNDRFYTYRFAASAPTRALLVESGANDPNFNLRREQALIRRMDGQADAVFYGVLEPHGAYDSRAETVEGSTSRIRSLTHVEGDGAVAVIVELASGARIIMAVADEAAPEARHSLSVAGETLTWTGPHARFDRPETAR